MRTLILTLLGASLCSSAQPAPSEPELDLPQALRLARQYGQGYVQALTDAGKAREDRVQAKAGLLPTVGALNQFIYTQPNGTSSGVFVSNDGVHVYNEQAVVHAEIYSPQRLAEYRRTQAAEAAARARVDIAARGLSATVAANYYGVVAAVRREANARRAVSEAQAFLVISEKQEKGGEVALADVIKARLQLQQREREALDATAMHQRAAIALGVLLWPDPARLYSVKDDLRADLELPAAGQTGAAARSLNPELRAAEASIRETDAMAKAARAAYLPLFTVDYFWGFNANVFNTRGPEDRKNLGSAVQATLTVPLWNWGATRSKVRQAELDRTQARFDAAQASRNLEASLSAAFIEAGTARTQLQSLDASQRLSLESVRLTTLRYQAGEATALEVVDAQSTLVAARNAYDDGLARYRLALAELEILTGRL